MSIRYYYVRLLYTVISNHKDYINPLWHVTRRGKDSKYTEV